jgi:hypothetical protein
MQGHAPQAQPLQLCEHCQVGQPQWATALQRSVRTTQPQVLQICHAADVLQQLICHPLCIQMQLGEVLHPLQDSSAQQHW